MCSADVPKVTPPPPMPEPVKHTESEASRIRQEAKASAARRFGVAGTNVTGGALESPEVESKKKTLGA